MKVINSTINFKGLDYDYVSYYDRAFVIKNDMEQLKELGKSYDIKLVTSYADVPKYSGIDIYVRPLKNKLGFFQRLFRPVGKASFSIPSNSVENLENISIIKSVEDAIMDLGKKMAKRR